MKDSNNNLNLAFYGDILNSKNYQKLKNLIHTGFYSLNGTYKFRVMLNLWSNFLCITQKISILWN